MIPKKRYSPSDILVVARRRKWLIALPCALFALVTAIATSYMPNRYRADTLILVVPQRVPESYVRSTVTSRIEDRLQSISQQILSRTRLERIIDDLGLYTVERRTAIMEDVVEQMRKEIDVEIVKGDAFRVSYVGDDPHTVMKVTERLASLFIEENLRDRELLAEGSYEFLDSQLEDARRKLVEHEKKLEAFRREYSGTLPNQVESNLQVIQNTQMRIQALNESIARDRDRRLMVERALNEAQSGREAAGAAAAAAETPGSAAQQVAQARESLRQLELRLKPEHPDVLRLRRSIVALEAKAALESQQAASAAAQAGPLPPSPAELARQKRIAGLKEEFANIDSELAKKDTDEKQLHDLVATYQARVDVVPTRESELVALTRDYDTLQKLYASLLTKKEDSKIAANLERRQIGEQFKVLDPARVPEKPFSPNRTRFDIIGALLGLALGVGLTVLLEVSDSTLRTDDEVLMALALPVLAMVPRIVTDLDSVRVRRRRLAVILASSLAVAVAAVWLVLRVRP